MPQLHLYVSNEIARKIKHHAEASGQTVSKYLAKVVLKDVGEGWPEGFFDTIVGGWKGDPLVRSPQGDYERRDTL